MDVETDSNLGRSSLGYSPNHDGTNWQQASIEDLLLQLMAWVTEVKDQTGITPIIYARASDWSAWTSAFPDQRWQTLASNRLWVADWSATPPRLPWSPWLLWQQTDSLSVAGMGTVDGDVFNGDAAALHAFTAAYTFPSTGSPPGVLLRRSCEDEASIHSIEDSTSTTVHFQNDGNVPLTLDWLDYQGQRKFYATIAAHSGFDQPTFKTHPWVLLDSSGVCRGIYIATENPSQVIITDSDVDSWSTSIQPMPTIPPLTNQPLPTMSPVFSDQVANLWNAIQSVTLDPRVRMAMLVGASLETGPYWTRENPFPDQIPSGPGRGPFQIEAGPGGWHYGKISEADARDPLKAAHYMLPDYQRAVKTVGDYTTDPALAYATVAFRAENPAAMYEPRDRIEKALERALAVASSPLPASPDDPPQAPPVNPAPFPGLSMTLAVLALASARRRALR